MQHLPDPLRCSYCAAEAQIEASKWSCRSCAGTGPVDEVGILHLRDSGSTLAIDEIFKVQIAAAIQEKEASDALAEAIARLPEVRRKRLSRLAFDSSEGGVAALLAPLEGRRALVLPGEWGARSRVLAYLGAEVWHVDSLSERVRFSRLLAGDRSIIHIQDSCSLPLPFRDASFDLAFVCFDDPLGTSEERMGLSQVANLRQDLTEFHRVLADGGQLVLDVPNRWNYQRFDSAVPVTGLPNDRDSLSLLGYLRVLRRSGFKLRFAMAPWPSRNDPGWLIPLERLNTWAFIRAVSSSRHAWFRNQFRRLIQKLRLLSHLAPAYLLLASKKDSSSSQPSRTPEPLLWSETAPGPPPAIRYSFDATVSMRSEQEFKKVALDQSGVEALEREERNTLEAHRTFFAPHVVDSVALDRSHETTVLRVPLIGRDLTVSPEEVLDKTAEILRGIAGTARRLDDTDLWRKLEDDRVLAAVKIVDASDLLQHILGNCGHLRLATGPVHGDLHLDNLRIQPAGPLVIVDWHSFQKCSPLFLDVLRLAFVHAQTCLGKRQPQIFEDFVAGRLNSRFASEARSLMGELKAASGVALFISQWWLHGLSRYDPNIGTRLAEAALVRDLLGLKSG